VTSSSQSPFFGTDPEDPDSLFDQRGHPIFEASGTNPGPHHTIYRSGSAPYSLGAIM
jgi:hypothetical protein